MKKEAKRLALFMAPFLAVLAVVACGVQINSDLVCPRGMQLSAGGCVCKPGLMPDPSGAAGCVLNCPPNMELRDRGKGSWCDCKPGFQRPNDTREGCVLSCPLPVPTPLCYWSEPQECCWLCEGGEWTKLPCAPPTPPPPTPSPSSIPTPTPPPPTPTPPPVLCEMPRDPVPVLAPPGRCPPGTQRFAFDNASPSICLAESSCEYPQERCGVGTPGDCRSLEWTVNYHARYGRMRINAAGFAEEHDGPTAKRQIDAWGRSYPPGYTPSAVNMLGDWTWGERPICAPKPCPTPTPTPEPTPTPTPTPGSTPSPGPTPATCPPLTCMHAQVHNAVCNFTAGPGCWVVIDATPLFADCRARGRCNDEFHNGCTVAGDVHAHTLVDSLDTGDDGRPIKVCSGFRRCEQLEKVGSWTYHAEGDSGYAWRKIDGPNVRWVVQGPGPSRGFQAKIDTPVPGSYRWAVCPESPRDSEGVPVQTSAGCFEIGFEVR